MVASLGPGHARQLDAKATEPTRKPAGPGVIRLTAEIEGLAVN